MNEWIIFISQIYNVKWRLNEVKLFKNFVSAPGRQLRDDPSTVLSGTERIKVRRAFQLHGGLGQRHNGPRRRPASEDGLCRRGHHLERNSYQLRRSKSESFERKTFQGKSRNILKPTVANYFTGKHRNIRLLCPLIENNISLTKWTSYLRANW